ncbi:hypothetical protein NSK_001383 [Nannochloropsis salina CCMP1776]|uniref:Uncharacterized protein n=1 Tax=Nannochloropsis salina CCMP1776 TaxID=1027361 RepID=A0A4D9DEG6_9STRA|nr:hypothetical protein NSK_001383 [Nannochloropsis salina CCMP1776]|eukprot:TFJ87049.1 hypothetical protein NSK_001383 [Nannochloropsis salina CCMP1776]
MGGGGQTVVPQSIDSTAEDSSSTSVRADGPLVAGRREDPLSFSDEGSPLASIPHAQHPLDGIINSEPSTSAVKPLPFTLPRNIYEKQDVVPFYDAPLIVAVVANVVWPAVLLVLTVWSMLVVIYFRLARFLSENVLQTPAVHVHDGDEAPVDMGLYFFGLDNQCEKWLPSSSSSAAEDLAPTFPMSLLRGRKGKKSTIGANPKGQCKFFDPYKPTVIYVHGFSRRTTARRFRETFNWAHSDKLYGLDINAADRWVREGWNIGIFFWNNHADEEVPQDTESKIWTSNGRCGMRYRTICPQRGRVMYYASSRPSPSISQTLADLLADVFRGAQAPYRLVGHSLGTQVVVHAATLLSQRKAREEEEVRSATVLAAAAASAAVAVARTGAAATMKAKMGVYASKKDKRKTVAAAKRSGAAAISTAAQAAACTAAKAAAATQAPLQLPTRIALLDAFATLGVKAYLSGWPIMVVVQKEVLALRGLGIVFEQFQTSLIGRRGFFLRHLTAFVQLDPPGIPWYRLRSRHVAAVYMYFLSFGHAVDGPRLKKADLRRHQSVEICFSLLNSAGGSLGGGLSGLKSHLLPETEEEQNADPSAWAMGATSCVALSTLISGASPSSHSPPLRTSVSLSIFQRRHSAGTLSNQENPNESLRCFPTDDGATSPPSMTSPTDMATAIFRRRVPAHKTLALGNKSLNSLQEAMPLLPPLSPTIQPPLALPLAPASKVTVTSHSQDDAQLLGRQQRHEYYSHGAYEGHNKNHLRWLTASAYREVEIGDFPLMARATDAEVRELMLGNYVYKQYRGHLFLRVSRAW